MNPPPSLDAEFARIAGDLAESLSFNRSLGQIYALLYISDHPLSLSEIAKRLSMSKGNASLNLRVLEGWGAVHPMSQSGTRQDFYEANRDLKAIALRRLEEGMGKRLDMADDRLQKIIKRMEEEGQSAEGKRKQVVQLHATVLSARRALGALPKLARFIP